MVVYAGQGDARRSMALLWRDTGSGATRSGPGPKPGLSVDVIVDAAIAVADADGMAGLSMRAVGARLGRTGMALYTYVPTKGELIDLMYDRALAELPGPPEPGAGWRADTISWAGHLRAFYLRHPWVLQVSQARPVLGPHEFAVRETAAVILRGTGLDPATVRAVVAALFHYVRGAAQTVAESRQAPAATGVPDEQWWVARSALLAEVAPGHTERFPASVWLETQEPSTPPEGGTIPFLEQRVRETFDIGLTLLMDGIEAAKAGSRP